MTSRNVSTPWQMAYAATSRSGPVAGGRGKAPQAVAVMCQCDERSFWRGNASWGLLSLEESEEHPDRCVAEDGRQNGPPDTAEDAGDDPGDAVPHPGPEG